MGRGLSTFSLALPSPFCEILMACAHSHDPQSTQRVLTKVPEASQQEMTRAVDAAEQAYYGGWRDSSILSRQRIMMKCVCACTIDQISRVTVLLTVLLLRFVPDSLQELIRRHMDDIATSIV